MAAQLRRFSQGRRACVTLVWCGPKKQHVGWCTIYPMELIGGLREYGAWRAFGLVASCRCGTRGREGGQGGRGSGVGAGVLKREPGSESVRERVCPLWALLAFEVVCVYVPV